MPRQWKTDRLVDSRVHELIQNFDEYHEVFINSRKWIDSLPTHIRTIKKRQRLGVIRSIDSDRFLKSLRDTLVGWGMEARNADLVSLDKFKQQFREHKALVVPLDEKSIVELDDYRDDLWTAIECLGLSETGSQIVTGSKALHHLLPKLLPPIDRRHTGSFFQYTRSAPQFSNKDKRKQKEAFQYILERFSLIAEEVDLSQYVDLSLTTYATSKSKAIDNAIVGFVIKHKL